MIEKSKKSNLNFKILEVGANRGEHLQYVANDYSSYIMTDIRKVDISHLELDPRISFQIANVQSLPFSDNTFDRVIATCLFHHIDDPMAGFLEIRRVAKQGGEITILLPNDPGLTYRFLRAATTLRNARKLGIYNEAQLVHALEHRNHFLHLKTLLMDAYKADKVSLVSFPFFIKGYNLNAVTVINIVKSS